MRCKSLSSAIGLAIALLVSHVAFAAAPTWVGAEQVQLRLVPDREGLMKGGEARFALQVRLEPGWKFYWREPGASGVAPKFDWAGSDNLAGRVKIDWPAPHRVRVSGADNFVYDGEVVLPMAAKAKDAAAPLKLRLQLDYGVCRDICVPLTHALSLDLPPQRQDATVFADLVARYRAQVPVLASEAGLQVDAIKIVHPAEGATGPAQLTFAMTATKFTQPPKDVFLEGPSGLWGGEAKIRPVNGTKNGRMHVVMEIGPPALVARLAGERLRLTLVGGSRAVEHEIVIARD